jgi:hypothetical protein
MSDPFYNIYLDIIDHAITVQCALLRLRAYALFRTVDLLCILLPPFSDSISDWFERWGDRELLRIKKIMGEIDD